VPEVLTKVRVHQGNLSKSKGKPIVWFEDFLRKTFRDDPNLTGIFRRRVRAAMYTNVALNQLEQRSPEVIKQMRALCIKAIFSWPINPGAYFGLLASLIPAGLRLSLLQTFRNWRNPVEKK
jgi:hypothetical protein